MYELLNCCQQLLNISVDLNMKCCSRNWAAHTNRLNRELSEMQLSSSEPSSPHDGFEGAKLTKERLNFHAIMSIFYVDGNSQR